MNNFMKNPEKGGRPAKFKNPSRKKIFKIDCLFNTEENL
jgi:hypothetical protein